MHDPLCPLNASTETNSTNSPAPDWRPWLERVFGALGCALVLAGIIYFFAFNWADLSKWTKFGLVEGAFGLCLAGVWRCGLTSRVGGLFVCAASVLIGVFLAVFGQIYQTGANAWQLFAAWAGFIVPWALITRYAAQWTLLLALINVALWLYAAQVHGMLSPAVNLQMLAVNLAALAAREAALRRGADWLRPAWTGIVPLLPLLATTTAAICQAAVSRRQNDEISLLLHANTVACVSALCLLGLVWYFHRGRDVRRLALTLVCGFPILCIWFMSGLSLWRWEVTTFFMLGCLNIGYAAAATAWLRRVHRAHQKQENAPLAAPPAANQAAETTNQSTEDANQGAAHTMVPQAPAPRSSASHGAGMPVAVMVVHSIGGILGAGLFALVCGLSLRSQSSMLGMGLTLIVGSTLLFRFLQGRTPEKDGAGSAGLSFCLSLVLLGLGLYAVGTEGYKEFWPMFAGMTVLLALLYVLFAHPLMRFTAVVIWISLLFAHCMTEHRHMDYAHQMILYCLVAVCAAPLALAALRLSLPRPCVPAGWAGICLLIAAVLGFVAIRSLQVVNMRSLRILPHTFLLCSLAAILLVLLLMELYTARRDASGITGRAVAHTAAGVLALAGLVWLDALGILLGLNLLMLGHGRRMRPLTILGAIFLPVFLAGFYYDLKTTLLLKSAIISGSGVVLLLGVLYLRLGQHFDPRLDQQAAQQEVPPCA